MLSNSEYIKNKITKNNIRKNSINELISYLNKEEDNKIKNIKFTSEKIAFLLEEEIFKQNYNSCRYRRYKNDIKKFEIILKNKKNSYIKKA